MKKGSAIKYTRESMGLSQKEVYKRVFSGSSSVYSRIENNFHDISEGQYDIFLDLLHVDFDGLQERENLLEDKLHNFFKSVRFLDFESAENQLNEFEEKDTRHFISCSDLDFLLEIYKYFFYIQTRNFNLAEKMRIVIENKRVKAPLKETITADFFYGIYLTYRDKFEEADKIFSKILSSSKLKSLVNYGDLYFYSCRTKSRFHDYYGAILLGQEARVYFNDEFNLKRSIGITVQLIKCFICIKDLNKASELLEGILRFDVAKILLPKDLPVIYHLKGSIYRERQEFDKAIDSYKESLEIYPYKDMNYLFMLDNICSILRKTKSNEYEKYLVRLLEISKNIGNIEHEIVSQFYLLLIRNADDAISYIESEDRLLQIKSNLTARQEILSFLSNHYQHSIMASKAVAYQKMIGVFL
jgi:tetratricopeptide (TPR) repeat protein